MKKLLIAASAATLCAVLAPSAALAQNIATVNGKTVPKSRVDTLIQQAQRAGQHRTAIAVVGRVLHALRIDRHRAAG